MSGIELRAQFLIISDADFIPLCSYADSVAQVPWLRMLMVGQALSWEL